MAAKNKIPPVVGEIYKHKRKQYAPTVIVQSVDEEGVTVQSQNDLIAKPSKRGLMGFSISFVDKTPRKMDLRSFHRIYTLNS